MLLLVQYETASETDEILGFQALETGPLTYFPIHIRIVHASTHLYGDARPHALYAAIAPVAVTCGSVPAVPLT